MHVVDEVRNDIIDVDDAPKEKTTNYVINSETSQKSTGVEKWVENDKEKCSKVDLTLKPIPWPPQTFLQRLKKKAEKGKHYKFMSILKELSMNVPLMEASE